MPISREDLPELHYIAHLNNLKSILAQGILCHRRAQSLLPQSVASAEVQQRRARKSVPRGLPLHDYANLYLTARNPMLYVLKPVHEELIVIRVDTRVLDLPDVVITDGNAASDPTAFFPSPSGLLQLDQELVFAESWWDEDTFEYWRKKRVKCAEILVPYMVPPDFVLGGYVASDLSQSRVLRMELPIDVARNGHLFFRD